MAKSQSSSSARRSALRALCAFTFSSLAAAESVAADSEPLLSVDADSRALDGGTAQVNAGDDVAADGGVSVPSDRGTVIEQPSGAYIADIAANGTGCPAGTWDVNLSADGLTYAVTFSEFYVEVDRTRAVSIKDCSLNFHLHAPAGLAFTVAGLTTYEGGVYLEHGVEARFQTDYYFQGHPDEGEGVRTDIVGPKDEPLVVQDTREDVNFVRSRCDTDVTLNVRLTMRLLNTVSPRRNGFVWINQFPAQTLQLSWKRC